MNILHLSDTQLSYSPGRISNLLSKYGGVESRHFVWKRKIGFREFPVDMSSDDTPLEVIRSFIYQWADVIVYHNRWKRQEVFKALGTPPPGKPSVIQIHSPRESEDFYEEVMSGLPIACPAQYHPRQWPECRYIVPNVVDILDPLYTRTDMPIYERPRVSYAPSNTNMRGWDDKSYGTVGAVLKRMKLAREITYDLIAGKPFEVVLPTKRLANIGVDEISTGSYHLSSLEYLSLGVATIARIDTLTEKVLKDLTGCDRLPWIDASKDTFENSLRAVLKLKGWDEHGRYARIWMERYWNPTLLCKHYIKMYEDLK